MDTNSPEYRQAKRQYWHKLEKTMDKVVDYLDKKDADFIKDPDRRDAEGKQKWEQQRIRNAFNCFDTLKTLQGTHTSKNLATQAQRDDRDQKAERYKKALLSEESRRIFYGEDTPQVQEKQGTAFTL